MFREIRTSEKISDKTRIDAAILKRAKYLLVKAIDCRIGTQKAKESWNEYYEFCEKYGIERWMLNG